MGIIPGLGHVLHPFPVSLEFLGLPAIDLEAYPRYTRRPSTAHMTDGARHRLAVYFRPHNERLAALLGENVWWESA